MDVKCDNCGKIKYVEDFFDKLLCLDCLKEIDENEDDYKMIMKKIMIY